MQPHVQKPATPEKTTKKVRRTARALPRGELTGPCQLPPSRCAHTQEALERRRAPGEHVSARTTGRKQHSNSVSRLRCAELRSNNKPPIHRRVKGGLGSSPANKRGSRRGRGTGERESGARDQSHSGFALTAGRAAAPGA